MDPEILIYDKKLVELKEYLPFLEDMESRLKLATGDKIGIQLTKIQGLKNLIKGDKRMKMENLLKCEQVLTKLYKKTIERTVSVDSVPVVKDATPASASPQDTSVVIIAEEESAPPFVEEEVKEAEVVKPKLSLNFYKEHTEVETESEPIPKNENSDNQSVPSISETNTSSVVLKPIEKDTACESSQDVSIDSPPSINSPNPGDTVNTPTPIIIPTVSSSPVIVHNVSTTNTSTSVLKSEQMNKVEEECVVKTVTNKDINKLNITSKSIPSGQQITTILNRMPNIKQQAKTIPLHVSCTSDVDMRTPFSDVDMRFSNVFINKPLNSPNLIICTDNKDKETNPIQCNPSPIVTTVKLLDTASTINSIPVILNVNKSNEVPMPNTSIPSYAGCSMALKVNNVPVFTADSDLRMIKTSYTDPIDIQNLSDFSIPSLNEVRADSFFDINNPAPRLSNVDSEFEAQVDIVRSKLKSVISKEQNVSNSLFDISPGAVTVKSMVTKDIIDSSSSTKLVEGCVKKLQINSDSKKLESPSTGPVRKYTRVLVSPVRDIVSDYRSVGSRRRYSRSPSPRRRRSKSRERISKYISDAYRKPLHSPRIPEKRERSSRERRKRDSSPRKKSRDRNDSRSSRRSKSKDKSYRKKDVGKESRNKTREIELLGKKIEEIIELNELKRKREKIVQELQEESFLCPEKSPEPDNNKTNKGDREDGELGESDEEVDMLYSDLSEDQNVKNKEQKTRKNVVETVEEKSKKIASSLIKLNMIMKDKSFKSEIEKSFVKDRPLITSVDKIVQAPINQDPDVVKSKKTERPSTNSNEELIKKMADIITSEILPPSEKAKETIKQNVDDVNSSKIIDDVFIAEDNKIDEKATTKKVTDKTDSIGSPISLSNNEDDSALSDHLKDDILKALESDTGIDIVSTTVNDKKDDVSRESSSKTVQDGDALSCYKSRRISLETYKEKHSINSMNCDDFVLKNRKNYQDLVKSVFTPKELARFNTILQPTSESSSIPSNYQQSPSRTPLRSSTPVANCPPPKQTIPLITDHPSNASFHDSNARASIPNFGSTPKETNNGDRDKAREIFSQHINNNALPPWVTPVNRDFDTRVKKHVYANPFNFTPNSMLSPDQECDGRSESSFSFPQNSSDLRGTGQVKNVPFNAGPSGDTVTPLSSFNMDGSHTPNSRFVDNNLKSYNMNRDFNNKFSPRSGFETPDRPFNSNNTSWDNNSNQRGRQNFPMVSPRDSFMSPRESSVPRTPQHETNYGFYGKGNDSFNVRGGNKLWNESSGFNSHYDQKSRFAGQGMPLRDNQCRADPRDAARYSNNFNRQYPNVRDQDFNSIDNYGSRTPNYQDNQRDVSPRRSIMRDLPGNRTPLVDPWSKTDVWGQFGSDPWGRNSDSRRNFDREKSVGRQTPSRDYDNNSMWMADNRMSAARDSDLRRDTSVGRQTWQKSNDMYSGDRRETNAGIRKFDEMQTTRNNSQSYRNFERARSVGRSVCDSSDVRSGPYFRNEDYTIPGGNQPFDNVNKFARSRSVGRSLYESKTNARARSVGPRSFADKDTMFPAYKGNNTFKCEGRIGTDFGSSRPDFKRSRSLARESSMGRTYKHDNTQDNSYDRDSKKSTEKSSTISKPMQKAMELIEKSKQSTSSRDPRLNKNRENFDQNQVKGGKRDTFSHRDPRLNKQDLNKNQSSSKHKSSTDRRVSSKDRDHRGDSRSHRDPKKNDLKDRRSDDTTNSRSRESKKNEKDKFRERDFRKTSNDASNREKDRRHSRDSRSKSTHSKTESTKYKESSKQQSEEDDCHKVKSGIRKEHCNQREKISHFKIPKIKKVDSEELSDNTEKPVTPSDGDVSLIEITTPVDDYDKSTVDKKVDVSNVSDIKNDEIEKLPETLVEKKKPITKKRKNKKKKETPCAASVESGPYNTSEFDNDDLNVEPLLGFLKSNKARPTIFGDSSDDDNAFASESSTKSDLHKPKSLSELNDMFFGKLFSTEAVAKESDDVKLDLSHVKPTRSRTMSRSSRISQESKVDNVQNPQKADRDSVEEPKEIDSIESEKSDVTLLEISKKTNKKSLKKKGSKTIAKKMIQKDEVEKKCDEDDKSIGSEDICNEKIFDDTNHHESSTCINVSKETKDSENKEGETEVDKNNSVAEKINESESENSTIDSPLKSRLRRSVRQAVKPLEIPKVTKAKKTNVPKTKKNVSNDIEVGDTLVQTETGVPDSDQSSGLNLFSSIESKLDVDSTTKIKDGDSVDVESNFANTKSVDMVQTVDVSETVTTTVSSSINKNLLENEDFCQSNVVDSSNIEDSNKLESGSATIKPAASETKLAVVSDQKSENKSDITSLVEILKNKNKMLEILAMLNDTGEEVSEKVKKRLFKLAEIESDDEDETVSGGKKSDVESKTTNDKMIDVVEKDTKQESSKKDDQLSNDQNAEKITEDSQNHTKNLVDSTKEQDKVANDTPVNDQSNINQNLEPTTDINKDSDNNSIDQVESLPVERHNGDLSTVIQGESNKKESVVDNLSPGNNIEQCDQSDNCKTSEGGTTKEDIAEGSQNKGGKKKYVKGNRELQMLHEYNFDMFISADVLRATGVRSCTIAHLENAAVSNAVTKPEASTASKENKANETSSNNTKTNLKSTKVLKMSQASKSKKAKQKTSAKKKMNVASNDITMLPRVVVEKSDLVPVSPEKDVYEYSDDHSVVEEYQLIKQKPCPKSKKIGMNTNLSEVANKLPATAESLPTKVLTASGKKSKKSKKAKKKRNSWQSGVIKKKKKGGSVKVKKDVNYCDKNYCFTGSNKEFKCKLCYYSGGNIVKHYKIRHPHSEIMISRLNSEQAALACESDPSDKINKSSKIKMYRCRFCMKLFRVKNLRIIFDHIIYNHTGEYKKECGLCSTRDMKKCVSVCNKSSTLPPADDFIDSVPGYMCGLCNYTQLSHENLKTHIWLRHFNEECELKEIDLTIQNARRRMLKSGMEVAKTEDKILRSKNKPRGNIENILKKRLRAEVRIKKSPKINKSKSPKSSPPKKTTLNDPVSHESESITEKEKEVVQPIVYPPNAVEPTESDNSAFSPSSQMPAMFPDSNVFHVTPNLNNIHIKQEIHEEQLQEEVSLQLPDVNIKTEELQIQNNSRTNNIVKIGLIQTVFTGSKPEYYCRINDCNYNSDYLLFFKSHIKMHNFDWDGFCDKCNRKITCAPGEGYNFKYDKALEHMLLVHSNNDLPDKAPIKIKQEVIEKETQPEISKVKTAVEQSKEPKRIITKTEAISNLTSQEVTSDPSSQSECDDYDQTSQFNAFDRSLSEPLVQQSQMRNSPKIHVRSLKDLMSTNVTETPTLTDSNSSVCQLRIESVVSLNPNVESTPEQNVDKVVKQLTALPNKAIIKDFTLSPSSDKIYISKVNIKTGSTVQKTIFQCPPLSYELFKCSKCVFITDEPNDFVYHFTIHDVPLQKCIYCLYETGNGQKLADHILEEHGPSRFKCLLCDYRASVPLLVSTHALAFHKMRMLTVCEVKPHKTIKDGALIKGLLPKRQCVPPFICTYRADSTQSLCDKYFYSPEVFEIHLSSHGYINLECHICRKEPRMSVKLLMAHMRKMHNFRLLVCPYCSLTYDTKAEALGHLMLNHPGRRPLLYLRLYTASQGIPKGDKVVLLNLDKGEFYRNTIDMSGNIHNPKVSKYSCQLSRLELDIILNSEKDKGQMVKTSTTTSIQPLTVHESPLPKPKDTTDTRNTKSQAPTTSTIQNFASKILSQIELADKLNAATNTKPAANDTKTVNSSPQDNDNDDDIIVLDSDEESTRTSLSGSVHGSVTNISRKSLDDTFSIASETHTDDEVHEKTASEKVQSRVSTQMQKSFSSFSDDALNENMKGTGIPVEQLFRCGNDTCKYSALSSNDFKDHLIICEHAKEFDMLSCYHCSKEFRVVNRLLDHIRTHGIHRYQCSLCYYCSYGSTTVTQHIRKTHKIVQVLTIPLKPFKNDCDTDFFIVKPLNDKQNVTQKRKPGPKSKVQPIVSPSPPCGSPSGVSPVKKVTFGPDEIDQLPLNPILTQEIYCSVCNFGTKVRSNLLRHLQMHANEIAVPSVAPINPVPHLESNEMHFDKMTNLALSSNINKPAEGKSKKNETKKEDDKKYPKFVPEKERFVCGSVGCKYISVDEIMLRFHWETLHSEENIYHCVHCRENLIVGNQYLSTGNIAAHLRLHEGTLYGCEKCSFIHPLSRNVEKHSMEAHGKDFSVCIRKTIQPGAQTNEAQPSEVDIELKLWQCTLCSTKMNTKELIQAHCKQVHKIKSNFKCSMCNYSDSSKLLFSDHFIKKHPGCATEVLSAYIKVDGREDLPPVDNSPLWWKQRKRASIFSEEKSASLQSSSTSSVNKPPPPKIPKTTPSTQVSNTPSPVETVTSNVPKSADFAKGVLPSYTSVEIKGEEFKCLFCVKFTTLSRFDMQVHLYEELDYRNWECLTCGYKSFSSDRIMEHVRLNHGTGLSKVLKSNAGIERWVEDWLVYQEKAININKQNAANKDDVLDESNLVIDEDPNAKKKKSDEKKNTESSKCPYCDFVSVNGMKMHLKRHWKIKPLGCFYCDASFIRTIELKTHINSVHTGMEYAVKINKLPAIPEIIPLRRINKGERNTNSTKRKSQDNPEDSPAVVSAPKIPKPFSLSKTHMCLKCESNLNEDEITTHVKTCNGGRNYPILKKNVIVYKCSICMQLILDMVGLQDHFKEEHLGMEINYVMHAVGKPKTKRIFNKPNTNTETIVVVPSSDTFKYSCVYCSEKFDTYSTFLDHHQNKHKSELIRFTPLTLWPLNQEVKRDSPFLECCVVGCSHKAPNINCFFSHVRSHYISYQCHYCNSVFSLYKFYQVHAETHVGMVMKVQQIFTGNTIVQDRLVKIFNMYKNRNIITPNGDEHSFIFIDSLDFSGITDPTTTSAVKSKTKQVARKSTTYLGQYEITSDCATPCMNEYSHYGVKSEPLDLKKTTINVAFFGTMKSITVEQLKAIENLFPEVVVEDIMKK